MRKRMNTTRRESMPIILQKINTSEDVLQSLKDNVSDPALKNVLGYAFIPKGRFLLPEGDCPFNKDNAPMDLTVSNLGYEAKNFDRFIRTDLTPTKREQLFIQLLESLHATEAALMILIKDQTLNIVYPNITLDKIVDAGFFAWPDGLDRDEFMLEKFKNEVQQVKEKKEPTKSLLEQNCGIPKKTKGRPKKEVN